MEYGENAPDITADRIARAHQQYEGALQIQTDRVFGCCCCKWTSLVTSEISWRSLFFRACTHTSGYVGVCVRASSLLPANAPNNAGGEFYSPILSSLSLPVPCASLRSTVTLLTRYVLACAEAKARGSEQQWGSETTNRRRATPTKRWAPFDNW